MRAPNLLGAELLALQDDLRLAAMEVPRHLHGGNPRHTHLHAMKLHGEEGFAIAILDPGEAGVLELIPALEGPGDEVHAPLSAHGKGILEMAVPVGLPESEMIASSRPQTPFLTCCSIHLLRRGETMHVHRLPRDLLLHAAIL